MKLQKFPLQNILLILQDTALEKKVEEELRKQSVDGSVKYLSNIQTISHAELENEKLDTHELIIVEGTEAIKGTDHNDSIKTLVWLIDNKHHEKVMLLISLNEKNDWKKLSEQFNMPIIYKEGLSGCLSETFDEQKQLYHNSAV